VFLVFLISLLIVGLVSISISLTMKLRVNEKRDEGVKLSWWSRDFRETNRLYREYYPASSLPDMDTCVGYLVYALLVAFLLTGLLKKS